MDLNEKYNQIKNGFQKLNDYFIIINKNIDNFCTKIYK